MARQHRRGLPTLWRSTSIGVYGAHRRLGVQFEYAFLGSMRSAAQSCPRTEIAIGSRWCAGCWCRRPISATSSPALRGFLPPQGLNFSPGTGCRVPHVRRVFHFVRGRDNPARRSTSPEGESEIVAWCHVEYFRMNLRPVFSSGEYSNMILVSASPTIMVPSAGLRRPW